MFRCISVRPREDDALSSKYVVVLTAYNIVNIYVVHLLVWIINCILCVLFFISLDGILGDKDLCC